MTQQEQQLLTGLIERVNGTQLANKDTEAERLLNSAFQSNPDALYILCQTVLVQQFAMDNSQRQLAALRTELEAAKQGGGDNHPQEHGSFLGNLFGLGKTDDKPQQTIPATTGYGSQQPGYTPVNNQPQQGYGYPQQPPPPGYGYGQPGYGQPGYGAPTGGGGMFGGGGGFLQGAMQTAAGVVAGQFAFRAIEDVFHGFGGGGEGRGLEGGNTEVVNNYYGNDAGSQDGDSFRDRLQSADGFDNSISPDIEDRRGDSQGFFGGGGDDSNDTSNFADDNSDFGDNGGGDNNDNGF